MKNEEAKFILGAYRPNGSDAEDGLFGEALKQVQTDPGLRDWFARKQAYDAAVAAKLAQISPPAGLRESILAGARVSGRAPSIWRHSGWIGLAAAAAIILVTSIAFWPARVVAKDDPMAAFALNDVKFGQHDGHGEATTALQTKLGEPSTRLSSGLALDFDRLRATGCRSLSVAGQEVFEVCFQRDGGWYHLYVSRNPHPFGTTKGELLVATKDKLASASWTDAASGRRYVVVSDRGLDAVKNLL
jgi:hypothetical protein